MKYAINLCDLAKYADDPEYKIMVQCMLLPILCIPQNTGGEPTRTINIDKNRFDEEGVLVKDDISEERMRAIVELVREGAGVRKGIYKNYLRIYASKTGNGGWQRI